MSAKVDQALRRVEEQLKLSSVGTMSTPFAQFIADLWTLVAYVRKEKRRKRA